MAIFGFDSAITTLGNFGAGVSFINIENNGTGDLTLPIFEVNGTGTLIQSEPSVLDDLTTNDSQIVERWAYDMNKKVVTKGEAFDEDVINLSIENILSTIIGERLFSPLFGSTLPLTIFEQINQTRAESLLENILQSIQLWETRITIIKPQIQMNVLTKENALTIYLPYIINRSGLVSSFSKKVVL